MRELVRQRVGRRGASLLFFALLSGVFAYTLFQPPPFAPVTTAAGDLDFMSGVAPLPFFGALWAVASLICLANVFLRHDRWGFAAAIAILAMWGSLWVYGAFLGVPLALVRALVWLAMAAWVGVISTWPEPPERLSKPVLIAGED
jgi:hypothetical protein